MIHESSCEDQGPNQIVLQVDSLEDEMKVQWLIEISKKYSLNQLEEIIKK